MTNVLDALTLAEQRLEDFLSRRSVSEYLAGFISIGTIAEPPPRARERLSQSVLSRWPGQPNAGDQAMRSSERTAGN